MNIRQLAQVGLGLLGVWALLSAVATFIQIAAIVSTSVARLAIAEVLPVALLLSVSYLLIFHNTKVAAAIFPDVEGAADGASAQSDLALTLVALTGVFLLVQATPGALNAVLNIFTVGDIDPNLRGGLLRRFIGALIPIGAGIYLIVRPGRLLDFLQRSGPAEIALSE